MRPVIGITTRPRVVPTPGGERGIDSVQHTYRDSVAHAGGIPLPLAPVGADDIPTLLARVDGVVLTGGGDVDPETYGGPHHSSMYGIDRTRDDFEIAITRQAALQRLPLLAICRGMQVVNVALGGTLIADIPTETGGVGHSSPAGDPFVAEQRVFLEPGCSIAAAIGSDEVLVNSLHHQAVRIIAPGLRVVGHSDDGIVECLEAEDGSWPLLAVQWHPEYLAEAGDAASKALFAALVAASVEVHATRMSPG